MRVTILDDYFDTLRTLPSFERLAGHEVTVWTDHLDDLDALAERLRHTEVLVLFRERTAVPADLLAHLPDLRMISLRSQYAHVDVAECTRRGVLVCSNLHADTPSYAAAELTWALALAAARDLTRQERSLRSGRWQSGVGSTLRGRTLGILGYGRIGSVVAGYADAFGMRVITSGGDGSRDRALRDGRPFVPHRALFEQGVVVSLHVRLVPATRGLVTLQDLAAMGPDSILVNTSRAGLIEPGALVTALRAGRPGRAAVDVFEREPLTDVDDELLQLDNVVCTPHIGFVTRDEYDLQFSDIFDQVVAFAAGRPVNVVNPEVLAVDSGVGS